MSSETKDSAPKKFAGLFPGQGSQHVGMGKPLFDQFSEVRELYELASDTLSLDFKKLCFNSDEETLAKTENTQPCLLLVSHATEVAIRKVSPLKWSYVAGHSIGEYAALVSTGTLKFTDAIKSVRLRGQLMQSAVPLGKGGMMVMLGWEEKDVIAFCKWAQESSGAPLEAANFNSPGQVAISGATQALEYAKTNAANFPGPGKAKLIPLKVSAPFHSSMMAPAEKGMREFLTPIAFQNASTPVVQNFVAKPVVSATELKENLIRQITGPVRWIETLNVMKSNGMTHAVELGCGKVLAGLAKKTVPEMTVYNLNSLDDLKVIEGLQP